MQVQLSNQVLPAIPATLTDYDAVAELTGADVQQPHLDLAALQADIEAHYQTESLSVEDERLATLAAAETLDRDLRGAWSDSMSAILWAQALVITLGLIVTCFIPETRLLPRRSTASA